MKRSTNSKRYRPEEVAANVRQADEVILHRWCAAYGAVDRDAAKRLKDPDRENASLKRLVADQQLDIQILKEIVKGNSERSAAVPSDQARNSMNRCLRTAGVPGGEPAPEHAAPSGAAESLAGPTGGEDAGAGRGEPAPLALPHLDLLHKKCWSIGTGENGIMRRRTTRHDELWGMDFVSCHTADGRPLRPSLDPAGAGHGGCGYHAATLIRGGPMRGSRSQTSHWLRSGCATHFKRINSKARTIRSALLPSQRCGMDPCFH